MQREPGSPEVEVRRATADDAQPIGAVFDAAVRAGWTYLGELADKPMFAPRDWDQLVADHAPPKVLLVATGRAGQVVGYTAVHPDDGEMFLLFVHPAYAGRGVGRTLLSAAHDALRAAGCQQAYLYTHEQNERALAVYDRTQAARRAAHDLAKQHHDTSIRNRLICRRLWFLTSPSGVTIRSRNHPGRPARWNIEPAIAGSPAHRAGWI